MDRNHPIESLSRHLIYRSNSHRTAHDHFPNWAHTHGGAALISRWVSPVKPITGALVPKLIIRPLLHDTGITTSLIEP